MNEGGQEGKEGQTELCPPPCAVSPQDPEVLSWGHPGLDTTPAPNWPRLQSLLQQLPPQDSDVGLPLPSFPLYCFPLFTYCGKK